MNTEIFVDNRTYGALSDEEAKNLVLSIKGNIDDIFSSPDSTSWVQATTTLNGKKFNVSAIRGRGSYMVAEAVSSHAKYSAADFPGLKLLDN